ncbi:MAG TPA: hypothetical protein VKT28_14745 [Puia sp.]|nr:hypothetical protein [Puia sp.]
MHLKTIEGKWAGSFTYGHGYPLKQIGSSVPFTIDLKYKDGLIKGICIDDLVEELMLKPATIEGSFENRSILFIKRYSCNITRDINNKLIAEHNEPAVGIQYVGKLRRKFFSRKYFFKGEWDISGSFLDETGIARYYTAVGKWSMKKIE